MQKVSWNEPRRLVRAVRKVFREARKATSRFGENLTGLRRDFAYKGMASQRNGASRGRARETFLTSLRCGASTERNR